MRWWKKLFEKVIADETLEEAFDLVIKAKRKQDAKFPHRPGRAEHYLARKDAILAKIKKDLINGTYHLSIKPSFYRMERGKMRLINPPSFVDCVVYHAIVIALRGHIEPSLYYYCMGSIPDKGAWLALNNISTKLKNDRKGTKYCLQIDISKCYASIPRDLLYQKFERQVKDKNFLDLLKVVIFEQPGTGVTLGAVTSGLFVNFYLAPIDRYIKAHGFKYLYHYVDDFVVLGPNKKKLHKLRIGIDQELTKLGLRLRDNWQVYEVDSRKIDFLGFRTGRYVRIDRKKNMYSFAKYTKKHGSRPSPREASSIESRRGRCKKFDSYTFVKNHIEPYTIQSKNRRIIRNESKRIHELKRCTDQAV